MANNKLYGYTPKSGGGNVGVPYGDDKQFINQNPFEFRKGMDYELTSLGCSRLSESTPDEREKATDSVLKNLNIHPSYYTAKIQYESKIGRNYAAGLGIKAKSFKQWLSEYTDENVMKPVDQSFKKDKMVKIKEAIKAKVRRKLFQEGKSEDDWSDTDDRADVVSDKEIKMADLNGLQDAVMDTKEALAQAQKTVMELGPDIKKLAKETNSKIKKNPSRKEDYLKVYQSDPDVKEFIKLRKMLKSVGLL